MSTLFDPSPGGVRRLLTRIRLNARDDEGILIALCAPLGAVVGLAVVLLHKAVALVHWADFGVALEESLSASIAQIDFWRRLAIPALGGLAFGLVTMIVRRYRQHEAVDPIEANALYGGRMSLGDSFRVAVSTVISNGVGASLGLEAAFSQLGAGLMSAVGQRLRLRRTDLRVFVAAGAGAAIAAAFNAPLAGAFYAFELVLGSYTPAALAQIGVASLCGTLAMRSTIGVAPIYLVDAPAMAAVHQWEYPFYLILGAGAAAIGIATMRSATWCETQLRRLPTPDWLRPAIGGVGLGSMALLFPELLGSGHGAIQWLFDGGPSIGLVTLLLFLKFAASALSIGSGFRGGLFSTSLFLGCLYGDSASRIVGLFIPPLAEHHVVFMLVGMASVAASIVGAPLTMVLMVLEVTGDFNVALAVLSSVVVAATITRFRFGYSFATWRFHQRGKPIRGGFDVGWLAELTVAKILREDARAVGTEIPLASLREQVPLGSRNTVFATGRDGHFAGCIDVTTIHDPELDDAVAGLVAGDLAHGAGVYLLPQMDVRTALARFEESEAETLPVLAAMDDPRIIGYVSEAYALKRFAHEMERQHSTHLGEPDLFNIWPAK